MFTRTLVGFTVALALAACGNQNNNQQAAQGSAPAAAAKSGSLGEKLKQKQTILVGTMGTYAPFTYHEKDGKLTGYDVEVTRAVAAKLGVQVEFKETLGTR